jgi:hypothetical protein
MPSLGFISTLGCTSFEIAQELTGLEAFGERVHVLTRSCGFLSQGCAEFFTYVTECFAELFLIHATTIDVPSGPVKCGKGDTPQVPRRRGSRTSRRASPSMLKPKTASEIAMPGQRAIHGARNM